jgi:hypothetical protein
LVRWRASAAVAEGVDQDQKPWALRDEEEKQKEAKESV